MVRVLYKVGIHCLSGTVISATGDSRLIASPRSRASDRELYVTQNAVLEVGDVAMFLPM